MSPHRVAVTLAAISLILAPLPGAAQEWQGPAAFAVRVADDEGEPIADARVLTRLAQGDPDAGPAPVTTGTNGGAVISGLAEREWFVEVSHPGYMVYSAYVDLRAGKKPQVGFSSQVNTDTSWTPMTVKFAKASPSFTRGSGTRRAEPEPPEVVRQSSQPRPSEPPEVVRPEPETKSEPGEPKPPEVVRPEKPAEEAPAEDVPVETEQPETPAPRSEVPASVPPEEAPGAEDDAEATVEQGERPGPGESPVPPEAPPVEPPEEPEPTPAEPAVEELPETVAEMGEEGPPAGPPPSEPPAAPETEAPPVTEPAPTEPAAEEPTAEEPAADEGPAEPSLVEEPTAEESMAPKAPDAGEREAAPPTPAEPAPAPATPGPVPRYLRSATAGSCTECEAGEWAVASEQSAARTGTGPDARYCPDSFLESVSEGVQLLADTPATRLDDYAGPVLTSMFRLPSSPARARLQDLLGPVTDPESYCQLAGVVLPRSASYTGYVLEAWDSLGGRACRADISCAVGKARWLDEPIVVEGEERLVVYSIFKNGSTRRERRARLTVYFQPPTEEWVPTTR